MVCYSCIAGPDTQMSSISTARGAGLCPELHLCRLIPGGIRCAYRIQASIGTSTPTFSHLLRPIILGSERAPHSSLERRGEPTLHHCLPCSVGSVSQSPILVGAGLSRPKPSGGPTKKKDKRQFSAVGRHRVTQHKWDSPSYRRDIQDIEDSIGSRPSFRELPPRASNICRYTSPEPTRRHMSGIGRSFVAAQP